jgi:hypothetical protein
MRQQVGDDILYTLHLADDQIAIAEDKDDLSDVVRKLQEAYEQRGLIINTTKSECMMFGNNEKRDLPLKDDYRSEVDKCKYLGFPFTENCNSNEEINNSGNKGRNIIKSLNSILWDKSPRKITQKRIYKTMVQSVTVCGMKAGKTGTNC